MPPELKVGEVLTEEQLSKALQIHREQGELLKSIQEKFPQMFEAAQSQDAGTSTPQIPNSEVAMDATEWLTQWSEGVRSELGELHKSVHVTTELFPWTVEQVLEGFQLTEEQSAGRFAKSMEHFQAVYEGMGQLSARLESLQKSVDALASQTQPQNQQVPQQPHTQVHTGTQLNRSLQQQQQAPHFQVQPQVPYQGQFQQNAPNGGPTPQPQQTDYMAAAGFQVAGGQGGGGSVSFDYSSINLTKSQLDAEHRASAGGSAAGYVSGDQVVHGPAVGAPATKPEGHIIQRSMGYTGGPVNGQPTFEQIIGAMDHLATIDGSGVKQIDIEGVELMVADGRPLVLSDRVNKALNNFFSQQIQ